MLAGPPRVRVRVPSAVEELAAGQTEGPYGRTRWVVSPSRLVPERNPSSSGRQGIAALISPPRPSAYDGPPPTFACRWSSITAPTTRGLGWLLAAFRERTPYPIAGKPTQRRR